jgi:hypothetical protein
MLSIGKITNKYIAMEELIAIPVEEYEHLKNCEKQLNSIYESMVLKNSVLNAQLQTATQTQTLNDCMKYDR